MVTRGKRRSNSKLHPNQTSLTQLLKDYNTEEDGTILVRRSDETMTPFDRKYIIRSLMRETALAPELYNIKPMTKEDAILIAREVERNFNALNPPFVNSSLIRELVNWTLLKLQKRHPEYALYRNMMSRVGSSFSDVWSSIWRVKGFEDRENANQQSGNPETIHKKIADMVIKKTVPLGLPPKLEKAHYLGDLHIHQLEYPNRPFCSDYDLRYVLKNGLLADGTGFYTAAAGPAKHPEVPILHAVKVMAAGQCNCQGGQGLFNFNVFLAPYFDGLSYEKIQQLAEMFLFETNETYVSRGGQLVFSSIQLEAGIPKLWKDAPVVMAGKVHQDRVYGDYEEEAQLFAKALLEKFIKGDQLGKMFFFPKPEIRLRKEYFEQEAAREIIELSCELSSKFGSSYFDNVIPGYRDADGQDCYQCCAYHFSEDHDSLEPKVLYEDGQHFSMGGNQVVTINLPRLAYKANGDDDLLLQEVERVMELARDFLLMKREWQLAFANSGCLPFLTQRPRDHPEHPPLVDLEAQSLIIGFVGANEMVQYHTGEALHESQNSVRLALRVLVEMERVRKRFVKETGLSFAIARTPAESTASRFAVLDLIHYPYQANTTVKGDTSNWKHLYMEGGRTGVPVYYTNGFMIDHSASVPLHRKIAIEEKSFPLLSGGNILNVFLGEHTPDAEALYSLTKKIAHTQVGYWSYTTDLTACKHCFKNQPGLKASCSFCGSNEVEHYSRITGYYQATSNWNSGKQQELKDRYRLNMQELM
ncbi:anaerobic ribonucleoside-triphosphate reductase [Candidatus Bathyarchaeota archaeon]|nr:anaerobic ribonucleoside-triphosphate reductase [Candidatus Bathyarchaeota archaeon]